MTPSHVYYRYTTARFLVGPGERADALRARLDLDAHDRRALDVGVLPRLGGRVVVATEKTPLSADD